MNGTIELLRGLGLDGSWHNFVFLGEAGSGKSEIAISFAKALARTETRPVHFFDLDMTKPLFRSRDAGAELEQAGITVHYQEQFMDAPTLVGGVAPMLRDEDSLVVLDVGGTTSGPAPSAASRPSSTARPPRYFTSSTPTAPGRIPLSTSTKPWAKSWACPM